MRTRTRRSQRRSAALDTLIETAEAVDSKLYTEESLTNLTSALNEAKALQTNLEALSQSSIANACTNLQNAIDALELLPVLTLNLDTLCFLSQKAHGYAKAQFQSAGWQTMEDVLEAADEMIASVDEASAEAMTQEDIDAQVKALHASILHLRLLPDAKRLF